MNDRDIYDAILQRNLLYFGIDTTKQLKKSALTAAKSITDFLQEKNQTEVSIVVSDNYYAKYALAIAIGLDTLKFPARIYCLSRVNKLRDQTASNLFQAISELSAKYLKVLQDTKSENILKAEAFMLALGEAGQQPSLRERESIKRITHFNPVKINLEYPAKGFSWDLSVSFDYAKTPDAIVFNSGINANMLGVGPGELEAVVLPNQRTHLSQNCRSAVVTDKPEMYKLDRTKFSSMDVIDQKTNLNTVIEKFKSVDAVMLDLDNLYADLLLNVYKREIKDFTRIEIESGEKHILLLKPATINSMYKVKADRGVITVSGAEIFTNIAKVAKFNSSKQIESLSLDVAALLKYNHTWLACIGGVVW